MSISMHKRFALGVVLAISLLPLAARAEARRSPLADAPAIRKRVELRASRLEFGAGFASTLNQDFYHSMFVTLKLGFHFTDWLSLSGFAGIGVANISTGFQDRVIQTLPCLQGERCIIQNGTAGQAMTAVPREPSQEQAQDSMSQIKQNLGVQLELTPFTGKYSLFGKLFAHYDFYGFAGAGFLNVQPTAGGLPPCDGSTGRSCAVSGFKVGPTVGVGFHSFFNDWLGLSVELRDTIAPLNPAGRDVNGDGVADQNDVSWSSVWTAGANLVIYLPATADISN